MNQYKSDVPRGRIIRNALLLPVGIVMLLFMTRQSVLPAGLLKPLLLFFSGGFIVGSIFMAYLGMQRSVLPHWAAVALVAVGGAVGGGLFFYGVGGDAVGTICATITSAISFGIGAFIWIRVRMLLHM